MRVSESSPNYTLIPRALLGPQAWQRLRPKQFMVALALFDLLTHAAHNYCALSLRELAKQVGVGLTTVRTTVKALANLGLLNYRASKRSTRFELPQKFKRQLEELRLQQSRPRLEAFRASCFVLGKVWKCSATRRKIQRAVSLYCERCSAPCFGTDYRQNN